jgi:phosphoglycerol transferase
MENITHYLKNKSTWSWLITGLFIIFFYLHFRNAGLYTAVLSDEWTYSQFSRLIPLRDVPVPSYLYFFLFRASNACGDGFMECVRSMNILFLLAAAPFVYLTARKVTSNRLAMLLALVSIAGPINVYTTWFMPESLYYLGFWVVCWLALRLNERLSVAATAQIGAALALLSLVKVHAMFLLPPVALFIAYSALTQSSSRSTASALGRALFYVAILVLSAAIVRFGIGYLAAGTRGLSLYGSLYENMAKNSDRARKPAIDMIMMALSNLRGHLMGLTILYGVPIASLGVVICNPRNYKSAPSIHTAMAVFTALILLTLLAVTTMFTASVAGTGMYETNVRLHMRYYDFALPLLSICLAAQLRLSAETETRYARAGAAALVIAVLFMAVYFLRALFQTSPIDGPEIDIVATNAKTFYGFSAMALANLLVWVWRKKLGIQLFLFAFLPIYTLTAAALDAHKVRGTERQDAFIKAGMYVRGYLSKAESDHLTVVGKDAVGLFKAQFYIDNPNVKMSEMPPGSTVGGAEDPKAWLLVFGDYTIPAQALAVTKSRSFSLYQMHPPQNHLYDIDFSGDILNTYLVGATGLSEAEDQGRWSDKKELRFDFARGLPETLSLHLALQGFGPNVGQNLKVTVGTEQRLVLLSAGRQDVILHFNNGSDVRSISMEVPHPVSPKELGLSEDSRLLGVMINRMLISGAGTPPDPADKVAK